MPRVNDDKLSGDRLGESSAAIRARVQAARDDAQFFEQFGFGAQGHFGNFQVFCRPFVERTG